MNIIVHGLGALGGNFGGRLLEAGLNVSFFVREKRAEQIKKEGFKIFSPEGNFESTNVKTYTKLEDVKEADLILFAVKGYHLDYALPQVVQMVKQTNAFVLPILNGIEHIEKLQQAVGAEKVIGGFAQIIATLNDKGHIIHSSKSSVIRFGPLHEKQEEVCCQLEKIHNEVKTNLIKENNILKEMWKKYIFITAFSGITSAMQLPAGFITDYEATFQVGKNVVYEMARLAEHEGIHLTEDEIEKEVNRLKGIPKDATSSMHQDMRKGLPLEVEHLQGGALRIAAKHHLSIPVIETLYGLLKPYEKGNPFQ